MPAWDFSLQASEEREGDEKGSEWFWLDPEDAFALQAHVIYGNKFGIAEGDSAVEGRLFWYLRIFLPGSYEVNVNRPITDCESGRQAMLNEKEWRDLRRKGLGKTITDAAAAKVHGHRPKHSANGRPETLAASRVAWRRHHKRAGFKLLLRSYTAMLSDGWRIADEMRRLDPSKVKVVSPRKATNRKRKRVGRKVTGYAVPDVTTAKVRVRNRGTQAGTH